MKEINHLLRLLLVFLVCFCVTLGCERRHYTKKTQQHVKVYKQHKQHHTTAAGTASLEADNDISDWIYWYIVNYNDTYYYYSSDTYCPPSSYSTFNWSSAKANPIAEEMTLNGEGRGNVQEIEEQTVPNDELGQQMEQTIDTTEQQISDMVSEGNPNTGDSESGDTSSDSSSGDSSGGDSGGGDGGGGGD